MKRKAPSAAEMKRQVAAQKARADNAVDAMDELKEMVRQSVQATNLLQTELEEVKKRTESSAETLASHDRSGQVISRVLGAEGDNEDYPDKPEDTLPSHLQKAENTFSRRMNAANNPVTRTHDPVETGEEAIGQFEPRSMKSEGPAASSLDPIRVVDDAPVLESANGFTKEKLDVEKFMHEHILITVHDTTDETQPIMPEVCCNGTMQYFVRGKPQWVRRKFVEILARAKKTTYSQEKNNQGGHEQYINIPHTALVTPFAVLQDSQDGKRWLRNILAEAS